MLSGVDGLLARAEIEAALLAYCRGIDDLDVECLTLAFHPGAMLEGYDTKEHPIESFAPFAVAGLSATYAATQHRLSNTVIVFDRDDHASVETYVVADHLVVDGDGGESVQTFAGRYVDDFERRDGRWAIVRRSLRRDWDRVDPITDHMPGRFTDSDRRSRPTAQP